jgi:hypothetical protein
VHDVRLRRVAVAHARDIADVDHRAVDRLDRKIAEIVDRARRVVELERVLEIANLLGADRRDEVLRGERVRDVLPRKAARRERGGIDVDLHLARFSAEGVRDRRTRHGHEPRAHDVESEVGEVLLGESVARKRELEDRHGRRVVVEDQRRRRAGRHLLQHGLRDGRDLRVRGRDVDAGLEEDLDDAESAVRVRLDVLDVVDRRRQHALIQRRDAPGHLVRRQARVRERGRDDRNADVRKDVGRRAQRSERPDDEDQEREDDERVGAVQREADDPVHCANPVEDGAAGQDRCGGGSSQ